MRDNREERIVGGNVVDLSKTALDVTNEEVLSKRFNFALPNSKNKREEIVMELTEETRGDIELQVVPLLNVHVEMSHRNKGVKDFIRDLSDKDQKVLRADKGGALAVMARLSCAGKKDASFG
ncbi:unnamed protein product [Protopolystoma xenopodis]|uniref:Uncharacterized protein n=1 Tax=Protopolystoma xenopodis TaxID=117903 RepID=A0A448WVG6_9PLAT|nr:unnamed protein product [Protopolystoma xenopodis]